MVRVIVVAMLLAVGASLALPAVAQQNCDKPGAMCGGNRNARGVGSGVKGSQVPSGNPAASTQQYLISDKDRVAIRDHFAALMAKGNCPPDLQKTPAGCVATAPKTWAVGKVLPGGVVAHPLPDPLLAKLTPPPGGYRYGRTGSDVLLLAVSGNMVMDDVDFLAK